MKPPFSREHLRGLLRYERGTGLLFWKAAYQSRYIGHRAGHATKLGYIRVTVDGRRYMAHVLIWFLMTGEWCPRGIDHRDTVGTNNRWRNLRRATVQQNCHNTKTRSDNALGVKGVFMRAGRKKPFISTVKIDGKQRSRSFVTLEEAAADYAERARENFGEFARAA